MLNLETRVYARGNINKTNAKVYLRGFRAKSVLLQRSAGGPLLGINRSSRSKVSSDKLNGLNYFERFEPPLHPERFLLRNHNFGNRVYLRLTPYPLLDIFRPKRGKFR